MKDRLYWMEHELRDNVGSRDYMVSIMSHKHVVFLLMIYMLLILITCTANHTVYYPH